MMPQHFISQHTSVQHRNKVNWQAKNIFKLNLMQS